MKGLNLFLVVCMLAFYCFGAAIMDSFVIYYGWFFVGDAEFAKVHQENGTRIITFYVLPLMINTILMITLLWFRPAVVSKKLVWMALGLLAIVWLSSAFIQIPIQFQLDNGKDLALLQKLIVTDWIRTIAAILLMIVVVKMLLQVVKKAVI